MDEYSHLEKSLAISAGMMSFETMTKRSEVTDKYSMC